MKLKTAIFIAFLLAQVALSTGAGAAARDLPTALPGGGVVAPDPASAGRPTARDGVSLDEAAARVRRQTGGRIIKATSRSSNGRTVHYIRVLTADGRVFTVRVDAASGRIL